MSNPFTTATTISAASDAQVRFLSGLLEEKDLTKVEGQNTSTRVNVIRDAIRAVPSPTVSGEWGHEVNRHLSRPLDRKGASLLIGLLQGLPKSQSTADQDLPSAEVVPAGSYALATTSEDAVNSLAFYQVDRPEEGKWAGHVFISHQVSGDFRRVPRNQVKGILDRIVQAGPMEASMAYGRELGECGVCHRTLTNDASRAKGIGPKCEAKF